MEYLHLFGGLIGVIFGSMVLSSVVFLSYSSTFRTYERVHIINYKSGIIAVLIGITSTTIASYLASRRSLKENTASLMKPKVDKKGKKILLERITFIWKKLPFLVKVTFRNVFRYKGKMFMTIIGVAGCTGLLFMGLALRGSIAKTIPKQRSDITGLDYYVSFNKDIDKEDFKKFEEYINSSTDIENKCKLYLEPLSYKTNEGRKITVIAIVPFDEKSFEDMINLREVKKVDYMDIKYDKEENENVFEEIEKTAENLVNKNGKEKLKINYGGLEDRRKLKIDNNSAIITDKLLYLTGKDKGEDIELQNIYNEQFKLKVGEPAKNYISHFVYMSPEYYDKIFNKSIEENTYAIRLKDNVDKDKFKDEIMSFKVFTSIIDMRLKQAKQWIFAIDIIVAVIIAISALLAFIVLYNLTYINISERIREISTIKVLRLLLW